MVLIIRVDWQRLCLKVRQPDGSVSHVQDPDAKRYLKRSRILWLLIDKFKDQGLSAASGLLLLATKDLSKRHWETLMFEYASS